MFIKRVYQIFFLLLCLVVVAAVGGAGYLFYRALPETSGTLPLAGVSAPVKVIHDEHGVPHIFAANISDAARALGYLHAGERLFQMEMNRRAGQGRLSEVIGADMLGVDKYIRTLALYQLAESSVAAMSPEAQQLLQAYADGVNAWLAAHDHALPPEFLLLKLKPELWKPADSVVWGKLMAIQLSKNYKTELLRAELSQKLNADQMKDLFPASAEGPVTTDPQTQLSNKMSSVQEPSSSPSHGEKGITPTSATVEESAISAQDKLAGITGLDHPASNEWVISGSMTVSGKPILANDPHLGLEAPVLWYLARVVTPELEIKGATVPGLPIFLLGQNSHIAWGFTTTGSDVQDLFTETVDPANPDNYLTPDGSKPFQTRMETIHVKDAPDVTIKVRSTLHGPVMSDIDPKMATLAGNGKVLALAFTALGAHDTTSEALMKLNRASNLDEFLDALKLYQAPPQNLVYADTDGHIGFINPGYVPVRKQGDGTLPIDGTSGNYEWTRLVPFEELPHVYDPPAGFIFNANNALTKADSPWFLGMDWEEPYRAERLQQYFDQPGKHTLDTSALMQADHVSLAARQLLPYLLAQTPADARAWAALQMLRGWNGIMDKDRAEPLIFEAWLYEMHRVLLSEKTGSALEEKGPYDALAMHAIIAHDPQNWCGGPDCNAIILKAFNEALDLLTKRDGTDMAQWHWGHEHVTHLRHKFYSHIPLLDRWSKLDLASSGDYYTLDRGGSGKIDPENPFARTHGGGYRGLYDLGDPSQSRFMIATGESGHIFSKHYGDLAPLWNDVKSFTLTGTESALKAKGLPELVFTPRQ